MVKNLMLIYTLFFMVLSVKSYSQESLKSIEGIYYAPFCDISDKENFKRGYGDCLTIQFLDNGTAIFIEHSGKQPMIFKYQIRGNDIYINDDDVFEKSFTILKDKNLSCLLPWWGADDEKTKIWKRLKFQ